MIEITQYQAFDGTLFDDMYKCLEYELKNKESVGYLLMIGSHGDKVDSPVVAKYVAMDRNSINYFNDLCKAGGCGCPTIEPAHTLKLLKSESDILYFYFDDASGLENAEWKSLDALKSFVDRAFALLKQYTLTDVIDC